MTNESTTIGWPPISSNRPAFEPENQLPPLVLEEWNTKTFLSWVEHFRPDAIVTRLPEVLLSLRRAGYNVPDDDVGVAYHTLDEKSRCFRHEEKLLPDRSYGD